MHGVGSSLFDLLLPGRVWMEEAFPTNEALLWRLVDGTMITAVALFLEIPHSLGEREKDGKGCEDSGHLHDGFFLWHEALSSCIDRAGCRG